MSTVREATATTFDVDAVRQDFPVLDQTVHGKPLAYLDNAATVQKPAMVIDALTEYYRRDNANIHRGIHALSERATTAFEGARERVRSFLNAGSTREIVFVRGTTEAINLVAHGFGRQELQPGDELLITAMEHHSNIVPWQMACAASGATLKVLPIHDDGTLAVEQLDDYLSEKTRLLAVIHVSNALGTVNPLPVLVEAAKSRGIPVLVDGAQAVPHMPVDVRELDIDFYAFSGHKAYGPTGIGVLYGKETWLDRLPPYQGGGDMIRTVTFEETTYNDLPYKFEAGTPHIAGPIGLAAALDWMDSVGLTQINTHENRLLAAAEQALSAIDGVKIIGRSPQKAGAVSFTVAGVHPHDIGTVLDHEGIAIRAGHHCAQPIMDRYGIPATARASFAAYNTLEEVERLAGAVAKVKELFG